MVYSGYKRGISSLFLLLLGCFAGAAASWAQNSNLLIADFEGGKLETMSSLALAAITDEQLGGTSEARLTLTQPGAQASRGALRISFRMAEGFAYPFAGVWALLGTEGLATDLSAYRGLRFYARSGSEGGAFLAGVGQFTGQSANYMAPFEAKPEWTLVELPFDKLQRTFPPGKAPAFVPQNVVSVGFSAASRLRGQFDLEIDQLELYK
jgi:hypothetical protein